VCNHNFTEGLVLQHYRSIFMTNSISFILLLVALTNISCTHNAAKEKEQPFLRNIETPTEVKTIHCSRRPFDYVIHSTGKVKPLFEQRISSAIEGKIKLCAVENGAVAKVDQVLITYFADALDLRLQRARTNLYKARLEFESQMMGYNSNNLTDTVLQMLRASSGLTHSELELKEAQLELAKATIRSPFDGRISNLKVQQGWQVKPGDELFTIYSDRDLYAEVKILETDIGLINPNYIADVVPVSNSRKTYKSKVFEINPRVDENGMVAIRLRLLNFNGLLPGMNVNATIHIPDHQALVVPREAVVLRSSKAVVFTIEDGLAKWNYVTVGLENATEIEVVDGLADGEEVIVSNNLQLEHDAPVKAAN
jgi:membrane fusion protein (multidrug efflux system)